MFHFTTNNDTIRVFQTWINTLINHYPAAGAGFSGAKMARRTGSVDEFELNAIGENQNQGVSFFFNRFYILYLSNIS